MRRLHRPSRAGASARRCGPAPAAAACLLAAPGPLAAASLELAWDPVEDARVALYQVHYGQQSASYAAKVDTTETSAVVTGLDEGGTYYFAVRACTDGATTCSEFSEEVSTIITVPGGDDDCAQTSMTIEAQRFGPGEHGFSSVDSIQTQGAVELASGSLVVFNAPMIRLGSGFRVDTGARFSADASPVACASAAQSDAGSETTAIGARDATAESRVVHAGASGRQAADTTGEEPREPARGSAPEPPRIRLEIRPNP